MAMNQEKNKNSSGQFLYLGRYVEKANFRAFIYNVEGKSHLANSYAEYERMIASGIWFPTRIHASLNIVPEQKNIKVDSKNDEIEKINHENVENLQKTDSESKESPKLKRFSKPSKNAG